MSAIVRLGLTLPSFQSDPDRVITVARAAENAGVDGVFAFDHLFRARSGGPPGSVGGGDGPAAEPRPALELLTMTAAVMAETARITVGTLVARAMLRPPANLAAGLDTIHRIGPGRLIAGVGAGDAESQAEDVAFGVAPPGGVTGETRLARLDETVERVVGRGYPVWVGGTSPAVRRLAAARADGWNAWGGTIADFTRRADHVTAQREQLSPGRPPLVISWGGLAVMGDDAPGAAAKAERLLAGRPAPGGLVCGGPAEVAQAVAALAAAGAAWVILGPLDSSDADNAGVVGEAARLLRSA